jgi:hypothetical protein
MKSKYFTTSDGQEFYTETNAINHARTLEDRTVTPPGVTVEDIEVEGATIVTGDEGTHETPVINLNRFNKAQLIEFAADNELSIDPTATNAVILEAIENQLTEKNQA